MSGKEYSSNHEISLEKKRIFISYAHGDDEPFVKRLRNDLISRGYSVWRDRESLASRGLTFLHEIQNTIVAKIDTIILVVGPKAIASKYVDAEWQTGMTLCKPVIPILRIGEYKNLPKDLIYHCPDFREDRPYDEALEELVRHLEEDSATLGEIHNAPHFPPKNYIRREELIDDIYTDLLPDLVTPIPLNPEHNTLSIVSSRGGGTGKSVIANALANQCEVRRAFPGGIFWIEASGEEISLRDDLIQILSLLSQREVADSLDEDEIISQIKDFAGDEPCLFVLDDTWEAAVVEKFQNIVSYTRSRILVTTRNIFLAEQVGESVDIDLLSNEESRELLLAWAQDTSGENEEYIERVLEECGNLPLALRVAGAYVGGDLRMWESLVTYLKEGDFTRLKERFDSESGLSLFRLTQASAERLYDETQILYEDLALFPKDQPIHIGDIHAIWKREGYSKADIDNFIAQLTDMSLADYGRDEEALILHDLQWDYVTAVVEDLPGMHMRIVENYREDCGGEWHKLEHDGYIYNHLARHLIEAGMIEELEGLLLDLDWILKRVSTIEDRNSLLMDSNMFLETREPSFELDSFTTEISKVEFLLKEAKENEKSLGIRIIYAAITMVVSNYADQIVTPNDFLLRLEARLDRLDRKLSTNPFIRRMIDDINSKLFPLETEALREPNHFEQFTYHSPNNEPLIGSSGALTYSAHTIYYMSRIGKNLELERLIEFEDEISQVESIDNLQFIIVFKNGGLHIYLKNRKPIIFDSSMKASCLRVFEDQDLLWFVHQGKLVSFDLATHEIQHTKTFLDSDLKTAKISEDGNFVAGYKKGIITIADTSSIHKSPEIPISEVYGVDDLSCFDISVDGVVVIGTSEGKVILSDQENKRVCAEFDSEITDIHFAHSDLSDDVRLDFIIFSTASGRIGVLNLDGKLVWSHETYQDKILSIKESSNGNYLTTTSEAGEYSMWKPILLRPRD